MTIRDFFSSNHTDHYNLIVVDFEGKEDCDIDDAYWDTDNSIYMDYIQKIGVSEYNEQMSRRRNLNYNADILWIGVEDGVLTMFVDSEDALKK